MDKKVNTPCKNVAVWHVADSCYMELFNSWMTL